jgi:hypothetical protein
LDLSLIPEIGIENYQTPPGSDTAATSIRKDDPHPALRKDSRQFSPDQ